MKNDIFEMAKDEFIRLDGDQKLEKSKQIFEEICQKNPNLDENEVNLILSGLNRAISYSEEQYLYKLMYEADRLRRQIADQKIAIKTIMQKNMANLKNTQIASNNDTINAAINDHLLKVLELSGIIKEVAEFAFVNVIEKNSDISEISCEIAKNLVYNAINEGNFEKERFLQISKIVLNAGIGVANESKIYAKELILGIAKGANEGIFKAISKFRDEFKFMPKEISQSLEQTPRDFNGIESDFITLLKELSDEADEPAKSILLEAAKNSYLMQLKYISEQVSSQIKDKLAQVAKIKDENMENLRKELAIFEENASQKLAQIKNIQSFTKAKELGKRLYDAATNLIENAKK